MHLRARSVAIACLAAAPAVALAEDCAVTGLEGDTARMQRDGAWSAISPGPLPGQADLVETGPATRLEISCGDGTVVTIGPDSRVDLADLLRGAGPSAFMQLLDGIMGIVNPPPRDGMLAVQTPVAIASVRSTEWLVEHEGTGTAVFVRAGQVAVANDEAEFVLGPGEGVTLGRSEVVKPVGEWGPGRLRQVNEALGFGWD